MSEASEKKWGRFDVHSHLLPGIDDGCSSLTESIQCARELVRAGYTHSFCTPHFWPNLHHNTIESVRQRTRDLQRELDAAAVPLTLFPGGEMNLQPALIDTPINELPTFGMEGKFGLIDLWADKLPSYFEPTMKWMQAGGITVILAHPERMRAVQLDPDLADYFAEIGVLLQGNLQCLGDPPRAMTRQVAERYLLEDRYFMLGMDLHNISSMPLRMAGLARAAELVNPENLNELTIKNPRSLISSPIQSSMTNPDKNLNQG